MSETIGRIPHSRATLPSPAEWGEVVESLSPGWVADGPCVRAFQSEAARWLGCDAGFAINSGTNALHLALLALGVGTGHEVLVPAYCCASLLSAVRLTGAAPVLVDCPPGGFNLCADDARRRVTPRTRAVVVAHLFGQPAPLPPFLSLGLPVVEDCAQSFGASLDGVPTGGHGAVAVGSFYATKVLTTGQGGLAATRDPELQAELHDLLDYDNRDDWRQRFSYGMSELDAALGLWQLERLPGWLRRRRELAAYYDAELGASNGATHSEGSVGGDIFFRYVVRTADADVAIAALQREGVDAKRPVYRPLHHYLGGDYPQAQAAHAQIVSLPLYPTLSDSEAERVVAAARRAGACAPGRAVREGK